MLNNPQAPALEVRSTSQANNLHDLRLDIQSALIDLWHHPRFVAIAHGTDTTKVEIHIQVLINVAGLSSVRPAQMYADMASICHWLQSHRVSYEIGHCPLLPALTPRHKYIKARHRLVAIARAIRAGVSQPVVFRS